MRVLIVNMSERTGGAAMAASRLTEALNANGVKARMLVRDKQTNSLTVMALPRSWRLRWHFLWERLVVWMRLRLRRQHLFEVDIANAGTDITRLPAFQEADIIHLHWINQGLLSLRDIRKILDSGKRVVWTMHDIWPATALCHLTLDCRQFTKGCRDCRLLPKGSRLAAQTWSRKQQMLRDQHLTMVACSEWLASEARQSALLQGQTIVNIPNPINTHVYRPMDRQQARQSLSLDSRQNIILFVAQRATNVNKGMQYLIEACQQLADEHPEMQEHTLLYILGGQASQLAEALPFRAITHDYCSDEQQMAIIYNAADVFVLPSLSENLPNTIMEAMACGVPCVGFRVGGIPEEIDHRQTGYVADYRNSADLAHGIRWVLCEADRKALSRACVSKVQRCYSPQSVTRRYIEVYEQQP